MRVGNFVYAATCEGSPVKIGMSQCPEGRVKELSAAAGWPLSLIGAWRRPAGDARKVEGMAHRILDPKRAHGEWFDVCSEDARNAVETAARIVDTGNMHLFPGYTQALEEAKFYAKMRPLPAADDPYGLLEYWAEEHADELQALIAKWERKRAKLRSKRESICQ